MIESLRLQRFKSWKDTGEVGLGRISGFFGTNSSGKTALLQSLLLLKQTVESPDRSRVLHTGSDKTYINLGTLYDVMYRHQLPSELNIALSWSPSKLLQIPDREDRPERISHLSLEIDISVDPEVVSVARFAYSFDYRGGKARLGMMRVADDPTEYEVLAEGYDLRPIGSNLEMPPPPVKSYGFPDQVIASYENAGFLSGLVLAFQQLFERTYYLGPLREYPQRTYAWSGERPQDVGQRGELAVPALLAARQTGMKIPVQVPMEIGTGNQVLEERVAQWLQDLGLIESFVLKRQSGDRKVYEVLVRRSRQSPEVHVTDVGFGVSQVLPVLVLCYYAPQGSTILLEHPEIHLHPSVQAGLADVFIDAIRSRDVQIILESHSEHLLRRLQRRIAEEALASEDAALYFVKMEADTSKLERLALDAYGNIQNWPPDFFGDEMEDLVARVEAEMQRRQSDQG